MKKTENSSGVDNKIFISDDDLRLFFEDKYTFGYEDEQTKTFDDEIHYNYDELVKFYGFKMHFANNGKGGRFDGWNYVIGTHPYIDYNLEKGNLHKSTNKMAKGGIIKINDNITIKGNKVMANSTDGLYNAGTINEWFEDTKKEVQSILNDKDENGEILYKRIAESDNFIYYTLDFEDFNNAKYKISDVLDYYAVHKASGRGGDWEIWNGLSFMPLQDEFKYGKLNYQHPSLKKLMQQDSYYKSENKMANGGSVMSDGKFKLRGFPPIDKVELMGLYDDFKENFSSKIERFTKHFNKVHNSKLRLIDIKELMDYAKMNFVSKGGIVEYHDYKGVEIMYEPTYEEYFVNDLVFNSLEKAHKYIDSGEANETPTYIQNLYRRGAMAKGGSVVSKENSIKEFFKKFGFNVEDIQKDEYSNGIEGWIVFYDNKNKYRVIDYSVAMYLIVHDKTTNKTDIIKQSKSFNIDNFAKGGGVSSWNTLTIEKIGKNFPYKLNALNEILQNAGGKRNGKIYDFSLDRQSNKYDTFAQFVYSASIILNDTGSDSVTPSGTYFSQKSLPIRFYLRLTIRKNGNDSPITINASKDVAGGMSIYKSMEVNSLYDIEKYINSIIRDNPPNNLENMVYKDGGSVKNGYMVFNYTDNLYATNEVFQTKNDAKRFIDEFKKRFVLQGYYRDSNMNKIDINDVDLYVLDADFNPYKFSEGGIVTYANLDLNTNRNIIAKAIEFISGTGVDAESMTLEGKEIRFKYRTSNTYTTISQKLISDTISTNRKSLELRGKNFANGGETNFDDRYHIIIKNPKGLVTNKGYYGMGYNKKEIINLFEEKGLKYNEKGEKFGGQALKEYEFFLKKPTKYDIQLPKKMTTGGSVNDFSEYNFQVGDKLDLGSKGIKYFKQYDGEKIIVVDSKSDLKSSKGSYTYPSSVKKVLNKRYSTGGRVKVGVFNENQLRNKEDKKAVEKAQKETGLNYTDTKIIKKAGQMFLEVYLIPNEEYYNSSKFNKGGGIADDNKNKLWYEVLQKFFKIFYGEYEDDTAEKHIKDSQVTTDQAKYYYENFMDKYKTERTLSDGFKIFKQSLTKEELDSIQISFNSEDYADAEEHDTQKRYSTITIKKKENFKKGGKIEDWKKGKFINGKKWYLYKYDNKRWVLEIYKKDDLIDSYYIDVEELENQETGIGNKMYISYSNSQGSGILIPEMVQVKVFNVIKMDNPKLYFGENVYDYQVAHNKFSEEFGYSNGGSVDDGDYVREDLNFYKKGGSVAETMHFFVVRDKNDKNYNRVGYSIDETITDYKQGNEFEKLYFENNKLPKKYNVKDLIYLQQQDTFTQKDRFGFESDFVLLVEYESLPFPYYYLYDLNKKIVGADGGLSWIKTYLPRGWNFNNSYKVGGSVDEQVYIDYMNKEKGFKRDRIYFDSYAEAVEWGRKNFEKFNTDMINYV